MILVPCHRQHVEIEIGKQTSLQPYDSIDIVVARVANTLSRLLYSSLSFSGCLVATWIAKRLLPSKVMRWFLGGGLVGGEMSWWQGDRRYCFYRRSCMRIL